MHPSISFVHFCVSLGTSVDEGVPSLQPRHCSSEPGAPYPRRLAPVLARVWGWKELSHRHLSERILLTVRRGVATMAALLECLIVPGASSRLPCSTRRECSTRSHKEDLALSSFRSRKADLALSSTRRRSFGRQQRGLQRPPGDGILAENLTLGRHTERAIICTRARPPGDDEKETDRGDEGNMGTVEGIEKALGKSFGGPLWFGILLVTLAVCGGGYVYLIYNYADFSDIPILNGPNKLKY